MQSTKLAIDPLWQCLCPSWTPQRLASANAFLTRPTRPSKCHSQDRQPWRRPFTTTAKRCALDEYNRQRAEARVKARGDNPSRAGRYEHTTKLSERTLQKRSPAVKTEEIDLSTITTQSLRNRARGYAVIGDWVQTRRFVEYLVKEKREKPDIQLYNALILANVSPEEGAAWRVHDLLDEMQKEGLQPDVGTCHAVLKVLAVHTDHLLRTDILAYMRTKWITLSEDGAHDVAVGLLKDGLFEQALERLEHMRRENMRVSNWLLDMFIYQLCEAGEIEEGYRIMLARYNGGEMNLSRTLWGFLLDKASEYCHIDATALVWSSQIEQGYLNASSGTCLNVLMTAARAGDAALATDVFTHLSKRGEPFKSIHYQLLIDAYLSASQPDLRRALSILTIMPLEKKQPTPWETRSLLKYIATSPSRTKDALQILRDLHEENRIIPIAALNFIIEAYVKRNNLPGALRVYKQIHTFVPIGEGAKRSFANVETFNLLLRACRTTNPPDEQEASFLVSELLALRVKPTALTYDRLILVFVASGQHHLTAAESSEASGVESLESRIASTDKGKELLDWAFRHFVDMQALGWMARFGTLEKLATSLAKIGDGRCWEVLQMAEDRGQEISGWSEKGKWARKNAQDAWDNVFHKEEDGWTEVREEVGGREEEGEAVAA